MNDTLLNIYHRFPDPLRILAASARGLYLKSWRYGAETEDLVEAALDREQWSSDRWKIWQEEQLAVVLHRSAKFVPYYREEWAARRRKGDRSSVEDLNNWPLLEKDSLREHPRAFVADDCTPRTMFHEHTSGTTGKPLDLWWSRKTVREWYALFEARCRRWYGVSRRHRWAILGGQLVTSVRSRKPPFWVWNASLNQLYMSSYHLAPDLLRYYVDAIKTYRITYLLGYTSSIYALAQELLRAQRTDVQMSVVITNAESLLAHQREVIEQAFRCPVRETYGMAEIVTAASECDYGQLHLWPEVGWVEVLDNNTPVVQGFPGDLVCTGLINIDMPLIRYRVGDRGALGHVSTICACGRALPFLRSLEGRTDDVLYTADGRHVGRLDPVFKDQLPIREVQIVQESISRIRVRYVPAVEFGPQTANLIVQRLQQRMGAVEVIFDQMESIPRTQNGKFQAVICQIPYDERKRLAV